MYKETKMEIVYTGKFNPSKNKFKINTKTYLIVSEGDKKLTCLTRRTDVRVIAEIHLNVKNEVRIAHGIAAGYGYDKESAAIEYAVNNLGYSITPSVAGKGIEAAKQALIELVKYVNKTDDPQLFTIES